jgi:hypothetical protein
MSRSGARASAHSQVSRPSAPEVAVSLAWLGDNPAPALRGNYLLVTLAYLATFRDRGVSYVVSGAAAVELAQALKQARERFLRRSRLAPAAAP